MKNKLKYLTTIIMVTIILSACGPTPAPTMSAVDIQGTAVAAAWTIVAITQAAIPTATPVPPTETPSPTPLPTFTPIPLPTSIDMFQPSPTIGAEAGSTKSPCAKAVLGSPATGKHIIKNLVFKNKSKETVSISIFLNETVFGECGYRSFTLGPNDSTSFVGSLPLGCYSVWAWTTKQALDPYPWEATCFNDGGHKSTFEFTSTSVKWVPP